MALAKNWAMPVIKLRQRKNGGKFRMLSDKLKKKTECLVSILLGYKLCKYRHCKIFRFEDCAYMRTFE
jgi:hypothetical protein